MGQTMFFQVIMVIVVRLYLGDKVLQRPLFYFSIYKYLMEFSE